MGKSGQNLSWISCIWHRFRGETLYPRAQYFGRMQIATDLGSIDLNLNTEKRFKMPSKPRPGEGFKVEYTIDRIQTAAIRDCIESISTDARMVRDAMFPDLCQSQTGTRESYSSNGERSESEIGFQSLSPNSMTRFAKRSQDLPSISSARFLLQTWYCELVKDAFENDPKIGYAFWIRSLARGYAMQYLNHGDRDRRCLAFTVGLLSEIGEVVSSIGKKAEGNTRGWKEADQVDELEFLGTTYTDIGYATLKFWGFPELVCLAAKGAIDPSVLEGKFFEWRKSYFRAVAVSEFVVDRFSPPEVGSAKAMGIKETFFVERDAFEYAVAAIERDLILPEFSPLKN